LKELLFGDYIRVYTDNGKPITRVITSSDGTETTYGNVRARNCDGYVLPEEIQPDRILEVNFVDIGQGDGCHVVTPSDDHFIIDAGQGDNMFRLAN